MKVLVIGSGGREHAICATLQRDQLVSDVWCAPGNAGTAAVAHNTAVDVRSPAAIAELASELAVDLVVIGPEAPLVDGAADSVRGRGVACFGPSAAAAQLEGSKDFAKRVMQEAGVPTARFATSADPATTAAALDTFGPPYVVKDDGLAAGKGVLVTDDRAAAMAHAQQCGRVVIEEYLDGPEVSLFVVTDGLTAIPLLPAQDFKRVGDDDTGPNTGGMGAYTPLTWLSADFTAEVMSSVVQPTLRVMRERGMPFVGLLYVGLSITARGPQVVEFNARFGDPETEAILPMLEIGLGGLLYAAATGTLADISPVAWRSGASCTVVVAASGYPEKPQLGDVIEGVDKASDVVGTQVFHAGTRAEHDRLVSSGGRVLAITATGDTLAQARERAYEAASCIDLPGSHFRHDIGAQR